MTSTKNPKLEDYIRSNVKVDENGCWIWQRSFGRMGYGQACRTHNGKRYYSAHRLSYAVFKGEIPEKLVIDHLCRVPACVNPKHLEAVTQRQNIVERGTGISANNAVKTHCVNGHLLSGQNLVYWDSRGGRGCRECFRIRSAATYKRRMERVRHECKRLGGHTVPENHDYCTLCWRRVRSRKTTPKPAILHGKEQGNE